MFRHTYGSSRIFYSTTLFRDRESNSRQFSCTSLRDALPTELPWPPLQTLCKALSLGPCVPICLSLASSLSLCLSQRVSVFLSLPLSLSQCISLFLSVSLYFSLCLSVSVSVSVSFSVYFNLVRLRTLCKTLSLCLCVSLSSS